MFEQLSDSIKGIYVPPYFTSSDLEGTSEMNSDYNPMSEWNETDINEASDIDTINSSGKSLDYDELCEFIDNADLSTLYDIKSDMEAEGLIDSDVDTSSDGDQKVLKL